MSTANEFGRRIAEARKEAGLTQLGLAQAIGSKGRAVQSWELGVRHPRLQALEALAKALDRDVSWFFETDKEAA